MKKRMLIVRGREAYSTDTRLVQGTAGAVSMLDAPTVIPELEE